jgi:hypothetical protein
MLVVAGTCSGSMRRYALFTTSNSIDFSKRVVLTLNIHPIQLSD